MKLKKKHRILSWRKSECEKKVKEKKVKNESEGEKMRKKK